MQSVGEGRNEYGCLFLWLVQYGTRDKCPSFCCKDKKQTDNHQNTSYQASLDL